MIEKIAVELGDFQGTLLIPLWGRAQEYESKHPIIKDKLAHEIVSKLDYDFSSITKYQPKQFRLSTALRAYHFDAILLRLIDEYSSLTVVNIGAGLDTTFHRVDNGTILWYDLDLPDTIALRRQLIPESARNRYIAKSLFDKTWYKDIRERNTKVVFVAAGVFPYLQAKQIKGLILDLIQEFPRSEIVFDTMGKLMIWGGNFFRNKYGQKASAQHLMHGGISSSKVAKKWSKNIQVIADFPLYSGTTAMEHMDSKTSFQAKIMNKFNLYQIVHLRLA